MNEPFFSIITVTQNSSSCLADTLESVLSQEGVTFEYVIVDGASHDGTIEMIHSASEMDPRISWISEPDEGIADAFNKGLKMAAGDWVGILNSDDCYSPGALAAVAKAIAEHPEVDVIHGNLLRVDENGQALFELRPADLKSSIWHQMPLNHPTMFVSRSTYERVGNFDKSLKIAMDYDLVLRLYKSGAKFICLDRVLAHMRYGGVSDDRLLQGLKDVWRVSTREGYPKWKASFWMVYRGVLGMIKTILRRLGLVSLLNLHPRFRRNDATRGPS